MRATLSCQLHGIGPMVSARQYLSSVRLVHHLHDGFDLDGDLSR